MTSWSKGHVVVAEDDAALRELLEELLTSAGHRVTAVGTGAEALRVFERGGVDVVLTDLIMPGAGGEAVLEGVRSATMQRVTDGRSDEVPSRATEAAVIVMTAFGSVDNAVRLIRAGAFDYVTKPVGATELLQSVERALVTRDVTPPVRRTFVPAAETARALDDVIAESAAMQNIFQVVEQVAGTAHPVLLTGERGTGKQLIARVIHAQSRREPFLVASCGAIPESLFDAELFGSARDGRAGLLAAAHGGTLYLDDVDQLPLALQPALLHFLETGVVPRGTGSAGRRLDVRVLASSHRDLEGEMAAGRLRDDLYWRLHVLPLEIPPLRDRPGDILPLARRFLADARATLTLDAAVEAVLISYTWPGNARELRTAMQRAAALARGPVVRVDDLPPRLRDANRTAALVVQASQQSLPLRAVERAYVLEIVRQTEGNKSRAAEILGLDRKTLYRKLAEYAEESDPESGPEQIS
jgi:DNA-binding NtrC family response regulator